jgi:hypothetical protein
VATSSRRTSCCDLGGALELCDFVITRPPAPGLTRCTGTRAHRHSPSEVNVAGGFSTGCLWREPRTTNPARVAFPGPARLGATAGVDRAGPSQREELVKRRTFSEISTEHRICP